MPYTLADLPFFLVLPLLLIGSAFFSASETAMFGLSAHERYRLARRPGLLGRAVRDLLHDPRRLLVTLMLGNMSVNVLYFVICSALLLRIEGGPGAHWWMLGMTIGPVVLLVLFGELLPKLTANTVRVAWVRWTAVPLLAFHRAVGPVAGVTSRWLIGPLGRLLAPPAGPARLTAREMQALLEMSHRRGVIGSDEQELIGEVIRLTHLKVRDVMIPRVDVRWIDASAPPHRVRQVFEESGLSKLVVVDTDIDHPLGLVYRRQFLLATRRQPGTPLRKLVRGVRFVPELQRVHQLLADFRRTGTKFAIAVDEYGGTAGLVALKDVVERMVGELDMEQPPGETPETDIEQLGPGLWRVGGRLSIHDWSQYFPVQSLPPRVATVGGLFMSLLGAPPKVGQHASLGNVEMRVESLTGDRVGTLLLRLKTPHRGSGQGPSADFPILPERR